MALYALRRTYEAVNLAGYVNDTLLSPQALAQGVGEFAFEDINYSTYRLPGRVVGALHGATRQALNSGQDFFGNLLELRRSFFFIPRHASLPLASVFGGLSQGLAYHPIADLLIGRGHDTTQGPPPLAACLSEDMADGYNTLTHFGMAGFVLEAAPLKCADLFETKNCHVLAGACLCAAVIGRVLLQAPRLCISAQALIMDAGIVGIFTGIIFVLGLSLRASIGILRYVVDFIEEDDQFRRARMARSPGNTEDVDNGAPGVDERVRNRLTVLTFQLQPLYSKDSATAEEITVTLDDIAANLRHYCSRLPDGKALRGGLALLKATVESLWTEEDGVVFNPPELGLAL